MLHFTLLHRTCGNFAQQLHGAMASVYRRFDQLLIVEALSRRSMRNDGDSIWQDQSTTTTPKHSERQ